MQEHSISSAGTGFKHVSSIDYKAKSLLNPRGPTALGVNFISGDDNASSSLPGSVLHFHIFAL